MGRKRRIQYPGAIYRVASQGHQRKAIFRDDHDRQSRLAAAGKACRKTECQVPPYGFFELSDSRFRASAGCERGRGAQVLLQAGEHFLQVDRFGQEGQAPNQAPARADFLARHRSG